MRVIKTVYEGNFFLIPIENFEMTDSFLIMFVHNISSKLAKIVYLNLNYIELAIFTTVKIKSSILTKYLYNNG